jgi:serine/threonine protein kinase
LESGFSLIQAFDENNWPKQRLPMGTREWRAPEVDRKQDLVHTVALRQTDIYSYGLLVWKVMANGEDPWKQLYQRSQRSVDHEIPTDRQLVTLEDAFVSLKLDGDLLFSFALDMFPLGDTYSGITRRIFEKTIRSDPHDRARSFSEIIRILSTNSASSADS